MPRLALVLHETAMLYESAIAAEVFGVDRSDLVPSGRWYDFVVATEDGRAHPWMPDARTIAYSELSRVSTVLVSSSSAPEAQPDQALLRALRAAHRRGSRVAALCTGAFVLAAAGLLDGRRAATHWLHAPELARRYPAIDVRADVLYVEDGAVLTSAGKSAALDLCVHLVHRDLGAAVANGLSRRLVVAAHRPGGQAQYVASPPAPQAAEQLAATLDWARARLDQPLTVEHLAGRAGVSSRHLARRMTAELQTTPLAWLQRERVARAQALLERTDLSVEQVATQCGLGTATTLRRHFHRVLGVAPTAYRAALRR